MFGPKEEEVTGDLRKFYNEVPLGLYFFSNVIWVIKLKRMRWVGHATCTGEDGNAVQGFGGETQRK